MRLKMDIRSLQGNCSTNITNLNFILIDIKSRIDIVENWNSGKNWESLQNSDKMDKCRNVLTKMIYANGRKQSSVDG